MSLGTYLDQLSDPYAELKVADLSNLSSLVGEEASLLAERWPSIHTERRRKVMRELADLAEDNIQLNFDSVFLIGLADEDADVRATSIQGLWEYEEPGLIQPLIRLLHGDQDAGVRAEAALALGRFVLLSEYGKLRDKYFSVVAEALQRKLNDTAEVDEVRARALEAIAFHDGAWVRQAIREAYESGVRRMKVSAVHAMGRSCEGRWLPLVLKEMTSEDAEIRYEAAVASGSIGDEKAVHHLALLLSDRDQDVRLAAITALGEVGGQQAKSLLLGLLTRGSEAEQEAAGEALTEMEFSDDPLSFGFRS